MCTFPRFSSIFPRRGARGGVGPAPCWYEGGGVGAVEANSFSWRCGDGGEGGEGGAPRKAGPRAEEGGGWHGRLGGIMKAL